MSITVLMNRAPRRVQMTDAGCGQLDALCAGRGPLWAGVRRREEWVTQALAARHLYRRDVDYLVRDERIEIINRYTGRTMPDRAWERGLHQLIEAKEGLEVSARREPLARISYQRF